jgi:hypothetical protein
MHGLWYETRRFGRWDTNKSRGDILLTMTTQSHNTVRQENAKMNFGNYGKIEK